MLREAPEASLRVMIRTLLLILVFLFLVLQFTGGIGHRERGWPSAICWDLTPNFSLNAGTMCGEHDGVLVWLKVFGDGGSGQYTPPPPVDTSGYTPPYDTSGGGLDPSLGVVFPSARARDLTTQCSRSLSGAIESAWDPDQTQIQQLELALNAVLRERLTQAQATGQPGEYYRQYAGVVIGGRQLIYVNGFHKQFVDETTTFLQQNSASPEQLKNFPLEYRGANFWQGVPVVVCDGGPSFFGAEYDPATGQFTAFQFNGPG